MNQNHVIKKQILDLTLNSQVGSFTFQNKVSEFFKREVVPALDVYCTGISDNSEVIRIECLEIDLGVIPKKTFEISFMHKLAERFPEKLGEALQLNLAKIQVSGGKNEAKVTKETREFELLEFFIKEGQLPWWAESSAELDIPAFLEQIMIQQPAKLKKFICGITDNPAWMKRLIYHTGDSVMEKIVALFQPQNCHGIWILSQQLMAALAECLLLRTLHPEKLKCEVWLNILPLVITSEGETFDRRLVMDAVVKQIAGFARVEATQLKASIAKKISSEKRTSNITLLKKLFNNKTALTDSSALQLKMNAIEKHEYLECLEYVAKFAHESLQELSSIQSVKELEALAQRLLNTDTSRISGLVREICDMLRQAGSAVPTDPKLPERATLAKQIKEFDESFSEIRLVLTTVTSPNEKAGVDEIFKKMEKFIESVKELRKITLTPPDFSTLSPFSAVTETFVANAGLVLLWPYLVNFFTNLGLVQEKAFINEDARERSVLLLQDLTGTDGKYREHELILNKILCGMAPVTPVNPFLEITKNEKAEVGKLLEAVIQNWPALKNISPSGLCELFLQREGMIFTRDGQRVLRVTEQACDILLDQMPWGTGTVKLPWMEELLLVEWRM